MSVKYRIVRTVDIDADGTAFGDRFTGKCRLLRVIRLRSKDGEACEPHAAVMLGVASKRTDVHFGYEDGFCDIFTVEQARQLRDTLDELLQEIE